MIVGIVPAWNASRQDLANGMKESGKGSGASNRHGWLRHGLVVSEVALSLVLLLGAGLLIRNFATLVSTDLGIDPAGLASVTPVFEPRDQRGTALRHIYYAQALARARTIPGVEGVALASSWPYGGMRQLANRPGRPLPPEIRGAVAMACDENYLGLMKLLPLRGRSFTSADMSSAAHVVVISRTFADRYFGAEDPHRPVHRTARAGQGACSPRRHDLQRHRRRRRTCVTRGYANGPGPASIYRRR